MKKAIYYALMLILLTLSYPATSAVVTFGEVGEVGLNDRFTDIGPFTFTVAPDFEPVQGIHVFDAITTSPGYYIGDSNAVDVFFNSTYRVRLTNGNAFDFTGLYIGASTPFNLDFIGYPEGVSYQYLQTIRANRTEDLIDPTWYGFNWKNLSYLEIRVGDLNTGLGTFDNFTYSTSPVPIPASIWLLLSGLVGLFGSRIRCC